MPVSNQRLIKEVRNERTIIEVTPGNTIRAIVDTEHDGESWTLAVDGDHDAEVIEYDTDVRCPEWMERALQEIGIREVRA